MKIIQSVLIVLLLIPNALLAQSPNLVVFEKINSTNISDQNTKNQIDRLTTAQVLRINENSLIDIYNKVTSRQIILPTKNGDLVLEIETAQVLSENFKVLTPQGEHKMTLPVFYRGKIKGDPQSTVVMTVTPKSIEGMVWSKKINLTLGRIQNSKSNHHIVYDTDEIKNNTPICGGEIVKQVENALIDNPVKTVNNTNCRVVEIRLEADNYTFLDWGGSTNVVNNLTAIFNNVVQLYKNDEINLQLSEIFVWTTLDPYNGATSAGKMLDSLDKYWNNQGNSFNGDIVHLVSSKGYGGGVAFIISGTSVFNGMTQRAVFAGCNSTKQHAKGVSTSLSQNIQNIPTYSWNVEVIAHEIGHNFGLPHTHNCSWSDGVNPPNAIDNCGPVAGYVENACTTGSTPPPGGGSIMSYCHLTSVGISFVNGFGSIVKAKMAAEVNAATCLGGAFTFKPNIDTTLICANSIASLTATGCTGGTYTWYESNTSSVPLSTLNPFNTPVLNSSTTYYVSCIKNSCESYRKAAVISLFSGQAPVVKDINSCPPLTSVTLSATGCSGFTLKWYNVQTGGASLFSGNNILVNGINSDTTFYVECQSSNCGTSVRSPLKIDILSGSICNSCQPNGLNCTENDEISRFSIKKNNFTIFDNPSTCSSSGFSLFITNPTLVLNNDSTYTFIVNNPGIYSDGLKVWIDYNANAIFENSEIVYSFYDSAAWTEKTFPVTIPTNTAFGNVRIRLKVTYYSLPLDPCSTLEGGFEGNYYGEIEDYVIKLETPCPASRIFGAVSQTAGQYVALNTIESQANIATQTTYKAGKNINLLPGFQAGSNEVFYAHIGGCP